MASRSLNRVQLIGNLTRDVELRYTSSGTPVATFTVATNRTYKDSSGKTVETAEFTNVVAWAKLGEICAQLLKKGSKVYIEGRLHTNSWEDQETGKTMRRTEVVATDMILLSGGSQNSAPVEVEETVEVTEEEIPADEFAVDFEELTAESDDDKDDSDSNKKETSEGDSQEDTDSEETPF